MRSYTPYGMMRNTTGTFNTNLGFIGRSQSSTTGLTYIRARYYDASVGRFTRVDPIKDGLNWYGYSYSNPVMYVDPYGLWSITIELYVIVGGGITIAHDENGSYFGGKLGLGLGGKAGSIDNETPRVPEPTPLIQLDPTKRKDANGDTLSEIFPDTYGDDSECSSKQESNLPDFKLGYSWNTNGAFGIGGDYGVAGGVSNNGTQLGFYTNKGGNLFVGTPGIGVNGSFEFGFQF
nr:RHS repeat-associated core domain-containing protein [Orenia marismortui]